MDKEGNHKRDNNISPTLLTPCRPVGLRRKRSGVATSNPSPLKLSNTNISSPSTPVHTGLLKTCTSTNQLAPLQNIPEISVTLNETLAPINCEHGRKDLKRKSVTSSKHSSYKRKMACHNIDDCPPLHISYSKNDTSLQTSDNPLVEREQKDKSSAGASEECCTPKRHEILPNLYSADILSNIKTEESAETKIISVEDIKVLKKRIEGKEKRLKELELTALYKRKHDRAQVAKEIDCWLQGCKEALRDLQSELAKRGQSFPLSKLLTTLGIPHSLVEVCDNDCD